jgi:hypothetical protein
MQDAHVKSVSQTIIEASTTTSTFPKRNKRAMFAVRLAQLAFVVKQLGHFVLSPAIYMRKSLCRGN